MRLHQPWLKKVSKKAHPLAKPASSVADALQRWDSLLDCVGFADLPSTLFNQSGEEHNSNLIRIAQFAIRPEATLTVDEVVQPSGEPSRDEED